MNVARRASRGAGLARRGASALGGHELVERVVVLAAGRAALEVLAHAGQARIGILARDLEIDVLVDQFEAVLAGHLGIARAEKALDEFAGTRGIGHVVTAARSLRRASCRVLYSAPRVVLSRSASTSIGTPLSASAAKTSRWCGVSSLAIADRMASSIS